jgi:hypothetical protein
MAHPFILTVALIAAGLFILHSEPLGVDASIDGLALTLSSISPSVSGALRRRRGRPRKFAAPSRAVTLTLPDSVLAVLERIDRDISRAIVGLTSRRGGKDRHAAAELSVFGRRAVITVQPSPSLAARTGVELVPLPDGRALIAFDQPGSIADLELHLTDALDDRTLPDGDRRLFDGVLTILRDARRSDDVTLLQRSIILIEATKRRRRGASTTSRAKAR